MVSREIRDHWDRVAALGCIVTFQEPVQLHHIHGGSVREEWGEQAMPGMGQRQSHWLVLPLHASLHTGQLAIDGSMGVKSWEARFGKQTDLIRQVRDRIKARFNYDMFEKAGLKV